MQWDHFLGTDYFSGISLCDSTVQYSLQKSWLQPSLFFKAGQKPGGALQTSWFYPEIFMELQEQIRVSDYYAEGGHGKNQVQGRILFLCSEIFLL